jgi:hypothetical protein
MFACITLLSDTDYVLVCNLVDSGYLCCWFSFHLQKWTVTSQMFFPYIDPGHALERHAGKSAEQILFSV